MKKHWSILLAVFAGIAAVVWATRWSAPPDVVHQGKKLSRWLEDLDGGAPNSLLHATNAIGQIGLPAVPFLLREMQVRESGLAQKLARLAEKQSVVALPFRNAQVRRSRAIRAFTILGPRAASAVPALASLLESDALGHDAAHALGGIGEPAVPVLAAGLGASNETVRLNALIAIGRFPIVPETVMPALEKCSTDPNLYVRCLAILALLRSDRGSAAMVSPLAQCFADTNVPVRRLTAVLLGRLGAEATSAVPALLKSALRDPDARVRTDASNALLRINPAALTEVAAP